MGDLHLTNPLQGWQNEFSVDMHNVIYMALAFSICLFGLSFVQISSMNQWAARCANKSWSQLHPALLMVTAGVILATMGMLSWFMYFRQIQESGVGETYYDVAARGLLMSAKTLMQILFTMQSQGHSICTSELVLSNHQELVGGMVIFGILSFVLEIFSDTEFWSTTTEYVYDTRSGIALVAFDCFWLWMFVTRCYRTFQGETRVKARAFYISYAPVWAFWFASLPLVAFIGRILSPWVRHRIIFGFTGLAHAATLAVLVHTFRPDVAIRLYDLKLSEYEPVVNSEEAAGLLAGKLGASSSSLASFDIDDDTL